MLVVWRVAHGERRGCSSIILCIHGALWSGRVFSVQVHFPSSGGTVLHLSPDHVELEIMRCNFNILKNER